jgi:hypothetical protein
MFLCFGVVFAQEESQIEELVEKLGDDDWYVREEAYNKIEALGAAAAPFLRKAYKEASSLEVRIRAYKLLKNIKTVSPEDSQNLSDLAGQFFKVKDPEKRDIVRKMRPIENASFWICSHLINAKTDKEKEDWAKLLFWFEFGKPPKFLNDKNTIYEEVLLQIIWFPYTRFETRIEAVRALGELGSQKALGTVAAVGSGELSNTAEFAGFDEKTEKLVKVSKEAMLAILKRTDAEGKIKRPENDESLINWWSTIKESLKDADEDFMLRMKEEEQRQKRNAPFLGVASAVLNTGEKMGGALVMRAESGTGAERAGIREDDLIVELDGWKIESWNDLIFAIRHCEPGDKVPIVIKRGDNTVKTTVEITKRPPGM